MRRRWIASSVIVLAACSDAKSTAPSPIADAPALLSQSVAQMAAVGTPFSYDPTHGGAAFSDPLGGGLVYAVTFAPGPNGFAASAGHIAGVPIQPGIVTATVTARDLAGRSATASFPIVTFAAGLVAPQLPALPYRYADATVPLPLHFVSSSAGSVAGADHTPPDNVTTDAGAALGRVLFYDTRLSSNDAVACASCHQQSLGFGDTARFSAGVAGGRTTRHAMALANTRFYQNPRYFWDERAASLELQVLQPIQNPVEMGMNVDDLVLKLSVTGYYGPLFESAFGTPGISSDRVARALAQFVRSLISATSRFDSVFIGGGPPDFTRLTPEEQQGHDLFTGPARCALCHRTNAQFGDNARNNGLDAGVTDSGAGGGRFKSPSLRNIAVRPPYMHDGRFATLADVVAFYDAGIQANPNLDSRLRAPDGTPLRLNLTPGQRDALVAYLRTLTDRPFLSAAKFASPFPPH